MNPLQLAQQMKKELEAVTWPKGSGAVVFGARGVHIFTGQPTEQQIPPGFPWALIGLDTATADPDDPALLTQEFTVIVGAEVAGDPLGEFGLIGSSETDFGTSAGKGALEIAERARSAVENLTGFDGASLLLSSVSASAPSLLANGKHLVLASFALEGLCTSAPHYAAPQRIAFDTGLGTWTWEGGHCSRRFDFLQYRLVRKAGTSPSTDPSDGTVVYTGTDPFFVGASTPGNTYTVFADYNARGKTTVEGSSGPEVGAYKVAT